MFALLAGLLVVQPARADDAAEVRKHYENGTKYYNLGEFARAIEAYRKAYELKPDPAFLYNIAQSYRLANDLPQALFFYRSFLRNLPDAPNRAEVQARIKALEEALAKQKEQQTSPPTGTVPPSETATTRPPPTVPPTDQPPTDHPPADDGEPRAKIPSPEAVGATAEDGAPSTEVPAQVDGAGSKPIYKKWWFWAGIGAVAVGTVAIVAVSSGGGGSPPDSHFGSEKIF